MLEWRLSHQLNARSGEGIGTVFMQGQGVGHAFAISVVSDHVQPVAFTGVMERRMITACWGIDTASGINGSAYWIQHGYAPSDIKPLGHPSGSNHFKILSYINLIWQMLLLF